MMKKQLFGKFGNAVEKVKNMPLKEFRETLVRLGISNKDGTLTKKYKKENYVMAESLLIKIIIPKGTTMNINGVEVILAEDAIASVYPGDVPKMFSVVVPKKCCGGKCKCE